MLDDDDDSHLSRETNPRHVIALINLDNLYFVIHRRRMILNPKKERTKEKKPIPEPNVHLFQLL